jgi:uncharacterized membrane protein (DUF4010 family)
MNLWKPYIISLAVGLLVGIERENSRLDQKALGVRTFLLLSLMGAIAGGLENGWVSVVIFAFSLGLIVLSYWIPAFSKSGELHLGLTTEVAAGIVFTAGYASHENPIAVAILGPFVALILFSKTTLHRFTHAIKPKELKAAITILLIAVVVVELAPDRTIDSWKLFNPRKFGYLVLTLATLEFLSYILLKVVGEKRGSLLVGFLGGLVSSTAVLISSSRQAARVPGAWRSMTATVLVAQIASFCELLVIVLLTSEVLFLSVLPALASAVVFCGVSLWVVWRNQNPLNTELKIESPLDWKGVGRLSLIFAALLALVSSVQHWFGHDAIYPLTFLAGLFELQGVSLANATLFTQEQIPLEVANRCVLLAAISSLFAKVGMAWFFGRNAFALSLSVILFLAMGLIFFVSWITS